MSKVVLALLLGMLMSGVAFAQQPAVEGLPVFADLDIDKDGFISPEETKTADVLLQFLDANKDGKVDQVEFDKFDINKDGKLSETEYYLLTKAAKSD